MKIERIININNFLTDQFLEKKHGQPAELDDYDFKFLHNMDIDKAWYWYFQDSYDGDGVVLVEKNGLYSFSFFSHCSCNSPSSSFKFNEWMTLKLLKESYSDRFGDDLKVLIKYIKNKKIDKNKVIERIQKLLPELMDLSFGCRIYNKETHVNDVILGMASDLGVGGGFFDCRVVGFNGLIHNFSVLGHPIYLRHVLKIIEDKPYKDDDEFAYDCGSLCLLWEKCSFLNSLQEIAKEDTKESDELFEFLEEIIN